MGRQGEGEAVMQTREARRVKQVGQPRQCSSKQRDGEKQVGQDGGGASSNTDRRSKQQDGEHGKEGRIRSKQQERWGRLEQAANGARWVKQ